MLRHSLETLVVGDPELAQRLCWPVEGDHVVAGSGGETLYRLHQTLLPLSTTPATTAETVAAAPTAGEAFVFGVGLGEQVQALLTNRPGLTVTAWERDPWLLRLALERHDWSDALATGRLRLLLGADLVRATAGGRFRPTFIAVHPLLGTIYDNERLLLHSAATAPPGATPQPLVALCAGGLFTDDLAAALRDEGFAVYTLDVHRLSPEELARAMATLRPQFLASINYTEGLAEFAAQTGCRLLVWEIDPATSALPPCRVPTNHVSVFTYRKANVADFHVAGFSRVAYLPLAADPRRRAPTALTPDQRQYYGANVAFVGSSLAPQAEGFRQAFVAAFAEASQTLAPAATGASGSAAEVMRDVLAQQRSDFSRYLIPAALAHRAPWVQRLPVGTFSHLARLLGEIGAAEKRAAYVARLASLGVDVWGDTGWQKLAANAVATGAPSVRYRGAAGHQIELTKIYNASLINLDVGRLYQNDIATMRVFDVLACEGFVLAEYCDALAELFQLGVELICYRDADDLAAKAAYYLARPAEARQLAARGRQAVLARHTIARRLRQMLDGFAPP